MSRFGWRSAVVIVTVVMAIMGVASLGCSSTTVVADAGTNCGTGSTQCGDTCTVIARDPQNCGACGKTCAAGEVCSQGVCASSCGGGTNKCANECVDTMSDPRNCGGCGKPCGANEVCMAGACASSCAMPTTKCAMSCVNTQTDRTNCGMCGKTCKDGEVCTAGACQLSCQQGLTKCNSSMFDGGTPDGGLTGDFCTNLSTDNINCGMCGLSCAQGKVCSNGQCATQCAVNLLQCGNQCVDSTNDINHCGNCNTVCSGSNAACASSVCVQKYGFVAPFATDSPWSPSYWIAQAVTVTKNGSLVGLGMYSTTNNVAVKMAIYTNNANAPANLFLYCGASTLNAGAVEIACNPTNITAGIYWVVANFQAVANEVMSGISATTYYQSFAYASAPPNTFTPTVYSQNQFNYWAIVR